MLCNISNDGHWLTIALPAYNVEEYVDACLKSIHDQLMPGVEVLVVEDRSTDTTWEWLDKWQRRWPELKLIRHSSNLGLSAARNTALDNASGQFIWFIDSDDVMLPGALEKLKVVLAQHSPDLVLCDFSVLRDKYRLKHRLRGELHRSTFAGPSNVVITDPMRVLEGAMRAGQLHTWTKIARRDLWGQDLHFPVGRAFEDLFTSPQLLSRAIRAVHVPSCWIGYRQRAGSILSSMNLAKVRDQCEALMMWTMPGADRWDALAHQARFEVDAQMARIVTGACRQLWRMRRQEGAMTTMLLVWRKLESGGLKTESVSKLLWGMIRRGRLARAVRLMYWILLVQYVRCVGV